MFSKHPKVFSHKAVQEVGNYVTPNYIIGPNSLFTRFCPHRLYPISEIGTVLTTSISCKLHGYEWNLNGIPINNQKTLHCKNYTLGRSGLLYNDFIEPNHKWVDDLANEKNLSYSHSYYGTSKGNWLWMMEIQADLCHIRTGLDVVHPELSNITNLNDTILDSAEGWALQTCATGWWLCIFPYTFIEYSKGCLAINYTVPYDYNNEFGFTWVSQFYFDPSVTTTKRNNFEKYFQDVFLEDLSAIEKYKHNYFPMKTSLNYLEKHVIELGTWVSQHLK